MQLVKVGDGKFINVEQIAQVDVNKKGRVVVVFVSGSSDMHGFLSSKLDAEESRVFLGWLDAHSEKAN